MEHKHMRVLIAALIAIIIILAITLMNSSLGSGSLGKLRTSPSVTREKGMFKSGIRGSEAMDVRGAGGGETNFGDGGGEN